MGKSFKTSPVQVWRGKGEEVLQPRVLEGGVGGWTGKRDRFADLIARKKGKFNVNFPGLTWRGRSKVPKHHVSTVMRGGGGLLDDTQERENNAMPSRTGKGNSSSLSGLALGRAHRPPGRRGGWYHSASEEGT